MDIERRGKHIHITLTNEEVCGLRNGNTYSERAGLTYPDSKVTVAPLSEIDPEQRLNDEKIYALDRLIRSLTTPFRAMLDTDADLRVFVPDIATVDVWVSGGKISKENIETSEGPDWREQQLKIIPEGGIVVEFQGSAKIVDVMPLFYEEELA